MLPTIIEDENQASTNNSSSQNLRTPKRLVPSSQSTSSQSKLVNSRYDNLSDGLKTNQHSKRETSPLSFHFYTSVRNTNTPYSKSSKPQKQPDIKETSSFISKKSMEEISERTPKGENQISGSMILHYDDSTTQALRKSLPADVNSHQKNLVQNNSKSARESLKTKFKDKEHHEDPTSSGSVNDNKEYCNLLCKIDTVVNKNSIKQLGSKSPNNAHIIRNPQEYRAHQQVTGDKTLLHSVVKHQQKEGFLHSGVNGNLHLDKDFSSGVKKMSNLTPNNKPKNSVSSPDVKLIANKNEVLGLMSKEKRDDRSASPNIKHKKSQKTVASISPTKIISISSIKATADTNNEAKRATPTPVLLSDEEKLQYGNRSIPEYEKLELLGRGGFALVWLGVCKRTGKKIAMKQMAKKSANGGDSGKNDLYYGQLLFKEGGEPREEFRKYPGITNIASFIDYKSTKSDDWHISELCGKTLSSLLFDMKGEFCKGERVYGVKHLELHRQFRNHANALKEFVKSMAEVMDLFSNYYIVHCDIKPENILINMDSNAKNRLFQLKIIDFGSAYNWIDSGNIRMATPEYMPPELLNALMNHNGTEGSIEQLAEVSKPWSVDVWSLGAVLLEILTGIPLWIPLKCKLDIGSKSTLRYGLFGVKGRAYDKIYQKQKALVENLSQGLSEYMDNWPDAENLFDLLSKIFKWDPKKRISPSEILQHPYVTSIS